MIRNKKISLIIPCRNEAKALRAVLSKLPKEIDEVIAVDNNSTDNTVKTAKAFGAKVFIEKRNKNGIGYGYALQNGLEHASGDILVCMDGDGSYPTYEISKAVKYLLKNNLDFISCSRLPFKDPKKMSSIRSLGVKILNLMSFALFGYKIKDSLSGMWIFRKSVLEKIDLSEGDWNFSLEIKLKSIHFPEISFTEYPISYHDRIFDKSKQNLFKTGVIHAFYLLYLKTAFLKYDLFVFLLKIKSNFLRNNSSFIKS
jgi:glycosyltransferase involved in cell wall biosynthesis